MKDGQAERAALYEAYGRILREELIPAMGCTEPIAIACAAAKARELLGRLPEKLVVRVSANIVKNVKSVIVPHTGGQRGIAAAAAAGASVGRADRELQVLAQVTEEEIGRIGAYLKTAEIQVEQSDSGYIFDIIIEAEGEGHSSKVRIAGFHTNFIRLEQDGQILLDKPYEEQGQTYSPDYDLLTVEDIIDFADHGDLEGVKETLDRQIACNTAIAEEGLHGDWGAHIGKILLQAYGDSVYIRAKAMAAAGSDARMNGCELPVVINSGSGNQGLTASLPVIVYARELKVSDELLYRALVVSNLVTIHLKTGIGRLSAYCGAISAGCGAASGVMYLYGGRSHEISHTIVNALAIDSGVVCDGAKASCAAKIASAVEAGLLGMQMQIHGTQFYGGDGIVTKGVENTIRNVGQLAREGMKETDREIIDIMISGGASPSRG